VPVLIPPTGTLFLVDGRFRQHRRLDHVLFLFFLGLIKRLSRRVYQPRLLAFPTLIVMVRSFSDASDLKRNLATKESEKKRSDEFQRSLNAV
jgi:hypothetical protein